MPSNIDLPIRISKPMFCSNQKNSEHGNLFEVWTYFWILLQEQHLSESILLLNFNSVPNSIAQNKTYNGQNNLVLFGVKQQVDLNLSLTSKQTVLGNHSFLIGTKNTI